MAKRAKPSTGPVARVIDKLLNPLRSIGTLRPFVEGLRVPDIRNKLFFTLFVIVLVRLSAIVPCPGIDPEGLNKVFESIGGGGVGGVVSVFNLFTGGALERFAVGALGIMPYITASIIMSLCTPILPQLERLKREGESGYQKLNQYTRYLTLGICVVQGWVLATSMEHAGSMLNLPENVQVVVNPGIPFRLMTVIILTCGAMILVWLGDLITDMGVGNGASVIITIGIVERLPRAVFTMWDLLMSGVQGDRKFTPIHVLILIALFVLVTAATVILTMGVRKVPIEHARSRGAGRMGASKSSFYMLRVNYANVMPIIFASSILMLPPMLLRFLGARFNLRFIDYLLPLFAPDGLSYLVIYGGAIMLFSFFWVASQFNPAQIADDLKRNNAYVPGVRPGKPTADFLDWTMTRVTTIGAVYLTALALLPMIFSSQLSIPQQIASFFGGTSLLIIVGVLLDTVRQLEAHLRTQGGYDHIGHGRQRSKRMGRNG